MISSSNNTETRNQWDNMLKVLGGAGIKSVKNSISSKTILKYEGYIKTLPDKQNLNLSLADNLDYRHYKRTPFRLK